MNQFQTLLKGINPSQSKALAGLDDITAAGMNGFTTLSKVSEIMSDKMLTKTIEKESVTSKAVFWQNVEMFQNLKPIQQLLPCLTRLMKC